MSLISFNLFNFSYWCILFNYCILVRSKKTLHFPSHTHSRRTRTQSFDSEFDVSIKHRVCQHGNILESSMISEKVGAPGACVCVWVREGDRRWSCQSNTEARKAIRYPVGPSVPRVSHALGSHWLSVGTHLSACTRLCVCVCVLTHEPEKNVVLRAISRRAGHRGRGK